MTVILIDPIFTIYFVSVKETQRDGFHLDIEDYLMGLLLVSSELV